jgi:asparagine synthase (glutamine-hydrolysing)
MCGIAGLVLKDRLSGHDLQNIVASMTATLVHRGPDDGAQWSDAEVGVSLGHRRLSIVDLSPTGKQPMVSRSGRTVIVYNGEVYNAPELRRELERRGCMFRGRSDTEVVLEACEVWGVCEAARRLVGMFAFAVWDRETRTLRLVRDRLGIKPLYWVAFRGSVAFGSELKALVACPGWARELDRDAIAAFMRHSYIPAPHTVYRSVQKLEPGFILTLEPGGEPVKTQYWDLSEVAVSGLANPLVATPDECVDQLESLLADAVKRRMVADVPLGAFLSGGIDSSTVVALMQAQSSRPVRTFSIGFHEEGYNEAEHAKAVARHLGTEHTELYVEPTHAREIIPRLGELWDEPFADTSQIPTYLVSQLTRQHVTVSLSGDGGDELFAGYDRYFWAQRLWRNIDRLPNPLRRMGRGAVRALSPEAWNQLFRLVPASRRPRHAGDKMYKLEALLAMRNPDALYRYLVTQWEEPNAMVLGAQEPHGVLWDDGLAPHMPDFTDRMQFMDTLTYLPDDILTKVDRASMAVGLEARVPLLDHRVVELSWRLPRQILMRDGQSKWPLRQVLYRHVPRALVERPKMGFGVPIDAWLRGPLREWAEDLLSEERLRADGIFAPALIRKRWSEHLAGRGNWHYLLWTVLMFQAWHDRWNGLGAAADSAALPV